MPTYQKRGGRWRVQLMRYGERLSKTFDTKAQARSWAEDMSELREARTLSQALKKYAEEVSPTKRGKRWEQVRLARYLRDIRFAHYPIHEIGPELIAEWRDKRLKSVSAATIRRELNLLSSVWEAARLEWRWTARNPVRDVRKPPPTKPRSRTLTDGEIEDLVRALGYTGGEPESVSQRVALAFLFALETAMRAGEIAGIRKEDIRGRVVHLTETKNGESRDVPLSKAALDILSVCPDGFDLSTAQIDSLFRKARDKLGLVDVHFHDTRRTATSRLSKKLDVMQLAKVTGHRDLKTLIRVYYSVSIEDLAERLG